MTNLSTIFLVCLALACSKVNGLSGDSSKSPDNKPSGGTERPSDVGEGVPGYLTDPEHITFVRDGDQLTVKAPPNTVMAPDGDPRDVPLTLLRLARSDISAANDSSVAVILVGPVAAAENGSIDVTLTMAAVHPLVLHVGAAPDGGKLTIRAIKDARIHAVYDDPEDGNPTAALDLDLWAAIREAAKSTDGNDDGSVEASVSKTSCQADNHFWDDAAGACIVTRDLVRLKHCWPAPNIGQLKELVSEREPPEEDADDNLEDFAGDGYQVEQCYKDNAGDASKIVIQLIKIGADQQTVTVTAAAFEAGDFE